MLSPQAKDILKRHVPGVQTLLHWRARLRRGAMLHAYFAAHPEPALHLGCGGNLLPGWLNTDLLPERGAVVPLDGTRPLPFAAGTFHRIFSEHMIEHIPFAAARHMLAECRRVLCPGGAIRLATPNLGQVCRFHAAQAEPAVARYLAWSRPRYAVPGPGGDAAHVINSLFYNHSHHFLYDEATLTALLVEAGFTACVARTPGESPLPGMAGLEHHGNVMGEEFNRLETLVVEARAPGA